MTRSILVLLLSFAVSGEALAKTNKVQHKAVVPPSWEKEVSLSIGAVTHMVAAGDLVVLAGQTGIASVGADGTVRWTTELPWAMTRTVAADGDGIAFTAWSVAQITDKGKVFNPWELGKLLDDFDVQGASVGYLGADGALVWQVDAPDAMPLAPPGLTTGGVAVNTGKHLSVFARADGATVGGSELVSAEMTGAFAGLYDHASRGEVVQFGDHLFTSFFSRFYKLDLQGNIVEKEVMAGLTPYVDITCGPARIGEDLIVFGSTGDRNIQSAFFAMKDNMKNKWKTWSSDQQSGCGDMTVVDDVAYASSNFWVMALDEKGKMKWASVNKKGGLYPSTHRGVHYVGGVGARKSYGDLMVVAAGKVFVGADNGHDVITVLDAANGAYVQTLDVAEPILSMAAVGGSLAVATGTGVRFLKL